MTRFRSKKFSHKKNIPLGAIFFISVICIFLIGITYVGNSSIDRQEAALQNAMERNIVHCYALEGFYPPSLTYIQEHYGLTYDSEQFIVDYQPIASNIYPDFTIINKGEQ